MAVQRSTDPDPADDIRVIELTREEGMAMFDRQARERLGMSGEEFLRRYDADEIEDTTSSDFMRVWMMIPLARPRHRGGAFGG